MKKGRCIQCNGTSESKNGGEYLCIGCEINIYRELHNVMDKYGMDKKQAYPFLMKNGKLVQKETRKCTE